MDDSAITCDEIIDTDAEAKSYHNATSNDEETKTTSTNFNEKSVTCKTQNLYFTCLFANYHCSIDSCYYLLLSDKISSKADNKQVIKTGNKHLLPFHVTNNQLREHLY